MLTRLAVEELRLECVHLSCISEGAGNSLYGAACLEFEWDEAKRQTTIRERGVDVVYAALIFEGDVLTHVDDRYDYGEERLVSLGIVDEEFFVVVHTVRRGATRLITAWKGGRDDRKQYEAGIAGRDSANEGKG